MTRFIHDQFAKDYLEEILRPYGEIESFKRVPGEVRQIDCFFSPAGEKITKLSGLGVLGSFARLPGIFEPFRNAASEEEICDCILKLLEIRGLMQREAKRDKRKLDKEKVPYLWILTPTASKKILKGFNAVAESNSCQGVYHLGKSLRTKIVAIHHLPNTPETLWLRILGRGKVRTKAIDQLEKLTEDHPLRRKVLELLYTLRQNLEQSGKAEEREDKELIMRLAPLYQQDIEKVRQEGLQEGELRGEQRGRQEGQRKIILLLLNHKFDGIELPVVERINRLSLEQLEAMGESLLDFRKISDLEAWLKDAEKSIV
ncbi:DUF4351 domain-containing protein [Cylindrospermopsis raciborskii Cr2010]|uniref:DUF4351 domain-containing protein n=1 Tax=Cylindrospermopsis raciborskii TaxID=77022 RepID=UPI001F190ED7|nr:DUF4351 domain-containing protein [Cylindrospermopsis raciborskii]UJL33109.1 DUF4351 domain-containing protein [Cylindrospermopsis raciborskii Cr2010]